MKFLKSRTFWTAVAAFVVNGFPAIRESIPKEVMPFIDAILTILITYFHVNPSQKY